MDNLEDAIARINQENLENPPLAEQVGEESPQVGRTPAREPQVEASPDGPLEKMETP